MPNTILERLKERNTDFTKSEKRIATYLLNNPDRIPLDTIVEIADAVKVSEMTVSRMLRSLGYRGLKQARDEFLESSLLAVERVQRLEDGRGDQSLDDSLNDEITALTQVYRATNTENWRNCVDLLTQSDRVYIAGFQAVRGLALDFSSYLEYVRPGVHYLDGLNGTYSEALSVVGDTQCLVIIDVRRYARTAQNLAAAAQKRNVPLIIISDSFCHWAEDCSSNVLLVRTDVKLFWDSRAGLSALLNLLTNSVVNEFGPAVRERAENLTELQSQFGTFL